MKRPFLKWGSALLTISVAACSEGDRDASPTAQKTMPAAENAAVCIIPEGAFSALPQDVLVGTDILPFADYNAEAPKGEKTFEAEMGGAVLRLKIENSSQNQVAIAREYAEPGIPTESRYYTDLCINESRMYGPDVRGLFVKEGLLWLELASGNDFIAPDLWVFTQTKDKPK